MIGSCYVALIPASTLERVTDCLFRTGFVEKSHRRCDLNKEADGQRKDGTRRSYIFACQKYELKKRQMSQGLQKRQMPNRSHKRREMVLLTH